MDSVSGNKKTALEVSDDLAAAVAKTDHRVTLASIQERIESVTFFNPEIAPHFTVATMKMWNGYIVLGKSAPADPENYDEELGRKFAMEDCIRQVWGMEGYLLCEKLKIFDAHTREQLAKQAAGQ